MHEMILQCKQIYTKGITLPSRTKINTLNFEDHQVMKDYAANDLQIAVFTLQNAIKNLGI